LILAAFTPLGCMGSKQEDACVFIYIHRKFPAPHWWVADCSCIYRYSTPVIASPSPAGLSEVIALYIGFCHVIRMGSFATFTLTDSKPIGKRIYCLSNGDLTSSWMENLSEDLFQNLLRDVLRSNAMVSRLLMELPRNVDSRRGRWLLDGHDARSCYWLLFVMFMITDFVREDICVELCGNGMNARECCRGRKLNTTEKYRSLECRISATSY